MAFSGLSNIFYGKKGKDLNLCTQEDFAYQAYPGTTTDQLQYNNATFRLVHKGKILPDLSLSLKIFDEDVINVKWTWYDAQKGKRQHFEVPNILVNTSRPAMANRVLYSYVNVTLDPFTIQFYTIENEDQVTMIEIDRFVYDFYLNWIGMKTF